MHVDVQTGRGTAGAPLAILCPGAGAGPLPGVRDLPALDFPFFSFLFTLLCSVSTQLGLASASLFQLSLGKPSGLLSALVALRGLGGGIRVGVSEAGGAGSPILLHPPLPRTLFGAEFEKC